MGKKKVSADEAVNALYGRKGGDLAAAAAADGISLALAVKWMLLGAKAVGEAEGAASAIGMIADNAVDTPVVPADPTTPAD